MMRMFVILLVSGFFGFAVAWLSRSQDKQRFYLQAGLAGLAGLIAAICLQLSYPVLFDHLFSRQSWFEWLPFVGSGFAMMLLPRSLILLPLGFGLGFGMASLLAGREKLHCQALLAFLAGFFLLWGSNAEHLPAGVQTKTFVYRVTGSVCSRQDQDAFNSFLEWNWSPHFGYESYSRGLSLSFLSGLLKVELGDDGPPFYVFVKEYWRDGKKTAELRTSCRGSLTASELAARFRCFARSRTSPF